MKKMKSTDLYPNLDKSDAYVYDALHYRHWDTWEDGSYGHVMIENLSTGEKTDLMKGEPYDCPTTPFGGPEDYVWHPDGKSMVYVTKKLFGTDYVNSTNTDLYHYDLESKTTKNLTAFNKGYDTHPVYSSTGTLAYLSMKRDGYEADKNDLKVVLDDTHVNLTQDWDGTVREFIWSEDGKTIYFTAPTKGTVQLFSVPAKAKESGVGVKQITEGQFDLGSLTGFYKKQLIAGRNDMNRAKEFYLIDLKSGDMERLTGVNDELYAKIKTGKIEAEMVTTTDGKEMLTWVIYPPDFDPSKKYPTLLYTQGGPQSALSQFYSYRWNFQLMAAQGYIIVAPNRRGMPGYGVEWNEAISKDWGGQCMQDYLAAIDYMAEKPFVDNDRLGCVGASFGGYSAFYLAGIHEDRFKTFIAHDGVFNLKSMYGTTEELFFVNWDAGGPYWELDNAAAQKTYSDFDPSNFVANWNTPMLIIQGGKDYRVPIGQSLEAFTAAQQQGIKSRLLYLPEENHWVLQPQNGLVWQNEFFKWLKETL
jgi:dipeptidyl aminopeptidase/acylaminoacyl peptidase